MHRVVLKRVPLRAPPRFPEWPKTLHRVVFVLFLLAYALVVARLWPLGPRWNAGRWPEGMLLFLTVVTALASLAQWLPLQNVLLAAAIIGVIAGGMHSLDAVTGIPFGPCTYTERLGQLLFYPLPWALPMIWVAFVLNARGVARLALRSWRQKPNYGLWLLGLTAALVVLLDLGLEPFATTVKQYWLWRPTKIPWNWYTTPWVNFVGWTVTALLILAFATPTFINKAPVKHPSDYHPLVVWLLLNALFMTAAAQHRLWTAVAVSAAQSLLIAGLALRASLARTT